MIWKTLLQKDIVLTNKLDVRITFGELVEHYCRNQYYLSHFCRNNEVNQDVFKAFITPLIANCFSISLSRSGTASHRIGLQFSHAGQGNTVCFCPVLFVFVVCPHWHSEFTHIYDCNVFSTLLLFMFQE